MSEFVCPVCGGTAGRIRFREGPWSVQACRRCGLMSTSPRPDEATLQGIYADSSYYDERSMTRALQDEARERARALLEQGAGGPLLDYGAGSGHVVHGARSLGIHADGVEPSSAGRALAKDMYDVELLSDLPTSSSRYATVTMVHVLEHVPEPVDVLRQLSGLLTDGGRIVIEVPHAGGTRFMPRGARRLVYDLPAHLFHFTPATLAAVAARADMTVESVRLFNPWVVEQLLARRGGSAAATGSGPSVPVSTPAEISHGGTSLPRRAWRGLLPQVRRVLPGPQFQAVLRRADERG